MIAVMSIIHAIVISPFVVLGILFLRGKGADLIAGYNTSSPTKKAKTDEKVGFCVKNYSSIFKMDINASLGTLTLPT